MDDELTTCCKNCKYLRTLWYSPERVDKLSDGHCCDVFNNKRGEYRVFELLSIDKPNDVCEEFFPKPELEEIFYGK